MLPIMKARSHCAGGETKSRFYFFLTRFPFSINKKKYKDIFVQPETQWPGLIYCEGHVELFLFFSNYEKMPTRIYVLHKRFGSI